MVKWKLQAVEPDTCSSPGCRYLEWWDVEVAPEDRVHTVAAFERVCAAHADGLEVSPDLMLGFDGNWKPRKEYIEYQRAWFRRLNHVEWLEKNPDEPMPETIRGFTEDPKTTGSVAPPPQKHRDGLAKAYGRNKADNQRKNLAIRLVPGLKDHDTFAVDWAFEGKGDARKLRVNYKGKLNAQERKDAQAIADIQFGPGSVTVEG